MDTVPSYSTKITTHKKTAIVLLGNSGAGKSTLLTQLGAKTFKSGVSFRKGFTKDVHEEEVELMGQLVLLIDVPGLYEPDSGQTQRNADRLTDALGRGYNYKLYFVLKADNCGPSNSDLLMMSKVNDWIKQANGAHVPFRVIVNQIQNDDVYNMYNEDIVKDKFNSLFRITNDNIEIPGLLFNIAIDDVFRIRYDEELVKKGGLKNEIAEYMSRHSPFEITMDNDLRASNEDITLFEDAVTALKWGAAVTFVLTAGGLASAEVGCITLGGALAAGGLAAAAAAVGGSVWGIYKVGKMISRASGAKR